MAAQPKFYLTTAIDYPNSRPHIGTAFEKIGADVQARYRRMEGYDVYFVMGNDENTVKVAKKAAELGQDVQAYCDGMAKQFRAVWDALNVSYDEFVQTSEPRHHKCARAFLQKVYDNGYVRKAHYEGWYCNGCEAFKTEQEAKDNNGACPIHNTPLVRRAEPCYFFEQSKFRDRLLKYYEEHPDFIQPESRRNEILAVVREGLHDLNITRSGETWGIKVPFDEQFTIYVWFDALLTYVTGIGYATDDNKFKKWWPADVHFIGKDITRFHCATWPAMLMAAGVEPPKMVFGHGFVYNKGGKIGKSLGNVVEPMEVITKFSADAFRYYFMRECPFPGDGDFTWERFGEVYNSDLANNLGNLYSRVVTLVTKNYDGRLTDLKVQDPTTVPHAPHAVDTLATIRKHVEACEYSMALQALWQKVLDPANQYVDQTKPWALVKTDKEAAKQVLGGLVESLRAASVLLKPFIPTTAEKIYRSFDFAQSWEDVSYADAMDLSKRQSAVRTTPKLDEAGKVVPLLPRIA